MLRVNQNILGLRTYNTMGATSQRLEKSVQKLSTGLRINQAADDAAGLSISEKMRRQIRGLHRAGMNVQDGVSLLQTAEGALGEAHSVLQRMRELAIQAANDTLTTNDRLELQREVAQLRDDLNRIAFGTEFNTKKLLNGSSGALTSTSSNSVRAVVTKGDLRNVTGDHDVSLTLMRAGISEAQRSRIFTIKDGDNLGLAKGHTLLQSIAQFYDDSGVFILEVSQIVHVYGNTKTTEIYLDGQMTLDDLSASIQGAIVSSDGLGITNSSSFLINTSQTKIANMGGYIEIVSGTIGEAGEMAFSGEQKVIDALGFGVIRTAVNCQIEATLRDYDGNVRQVRTESGIASGLLRGIDIHFESQPAQLASKGGIEAGLFFPQQESFTLRIGGGLVPVTVASGNWTLEGLKRNFNWQIQGAINNPLNPQNDLNGLEARVVDGQIRFIYVRPLTAAASLDPTLYIANHSDPQGGVLGFLDGYYSGFVDGRKNERYIEWGFSRYTDLSVPSGFIFTMSVSDGIPGIGATIKVMTAQLSTEVIQPDMVRFTTFQSRVNEELKKAGVAVRVDQVGSTMTFTSLRVGREHPDDKVPLNSIVTLNPVDQTIPGYTPQDQAASENWLFKMGFNYGTALGKGDSNFRIGVIENTMTLQIGADKGLDMVVGIVDMSSRALGVDYVDVSTIKGAQRSLARLNKAIDLVSAERSRLGATQNRLEYTIDNIRVQHTNLTAAESRLRDADIAVEMMEFTRNQIVHQSSTAMMAHANAIPQTVLQLLQ